MFTWRVGCLRGGLTFFFSSSVFPRVVPPCFLLGTPKTGLQANRAPKGPKGPEGEGAMYCEARPMFFRRAWVEMGPLSEKQNSQKEVHLFCSTRDAMLLGDGWIAAFPPAALVVGVDPPVLSPGVPRPPPRPFSDDAAAPFLPPTGEHHGRWFRGYRRSLGRRHEEGCHGYAIGLAVLRGGEGGWVGRSLGRSVARSIRRLLHDPAASLSFVSVHPSCLSMGIPSRCLSLFPPPPRRHPPLYRIDGVRVWSSFRRRGVVILAVLGLSLFFCFRFVWRA